MLLHSRVKAWTMSKELLNRLPANGRKMNPALVKISPHSLVTSSDHKLSSEHLHLGPNVDVSQSIILWSPPIHTTTAGDVQMSS